ncbi:putative ribonuclease H-like domain-containing protein [Tanacetum coccineum]
MKYGLVSINTARQVNAAHSKTTVNAARPMSCLSKTAHSTVKRPIHKNTTFKNSNFNQRVNTIKDKNVNTVRPKAVVNAARPKAVVNAVKGNNVNVVKASACWGNPQMDLQDQGVIDSGCSRHMTGNMSYLTNYEEIDGGYVAFGGNPKGGKITGKGTIKTGNLDFENVYFVRELKFNLFSVSQMCDKKNSVLFNDTECIVLSPNFKLIDESQVLLRVPRKNNMLGHLNIKTMNKLVKGNLVRGLPSKLFENDQTCVACQKRKQHRASCKSKTENSISLPLHLLHMDLFGLTFVKSLMKKMYCLVVTDDFSRFTWVFFLATKDETSGILKSFITGIENLVDHKVKVIRCDNGTEFKNKEMNQFCEMKGILRQFSIAGTPQQNEVAKRRNITLIEAARTMLADSKTPTLSFMRPFECPVTILNTIDHLCKFDGKADEGFFVGYSLNSKDFRVFNSRTRTVEENLHIRFSENTPNVIGSGPDWLFDIDAQTTTMNYEPIVADTQSNGFTDKKKQKRSKTDKKREKDKESRARQRNQPEITAGSARHSQTQSKKEIKEVKSQKSSQRAKNVKCAKFQVLIGSIKVSRTKVVKRAKLFIKKKRSETTTRAELAISKPLLTLAWAGQRPKTFNGKNITCPVDARKIIITESSVRRDLQLADEKCLSPKTTAWNEFSSTMASAIICLATNKKFNFSKLIFDSMIRNLDSKQAKFLMYPRFENVTKHSNDSLARKSNTLQSDRIDLNYDELMALSTTLQNRIDAIDVNEEGFDPGYRVHDIMFFCKRGSAASAATTVSAATINTVDDITLAQALKEMKSTKPKKKGIVIQELGESTIKISSTN